MWSFTTCDVQIRKQVNCVKKLPEPGEETSKINCRGQQCRNERNPEVDWSANRRATVVIVDAQSKAANKQEAEGKLSLKSVDKHYFNKTKYRQI